jgi:MoaA/NifB/PqqE/SkfB family radical SAM enzyme
LPADPSPAAVVSAPAAPAAPAAARGPSHLRAADLLQREQIANRPKHWVRAVTACNSRCLFCLDADTPRNVYLPADEVKAELRRGIEQLGADKVIISGGEASLHPEFPAFIRYAKEIGYDRVQTVTNGTRFADRDYYRTCMAAGLGEITFSLHGHTPELHDHLTQTPGGFHKLVKGMVRALRDPAGPIVNMDVVINKQNVGVLDKIIEFAISLGVREFDLLHVIPQANAYDNREVMFYDVADHVDVLHKVFRLNRHPGFVIWTNRFPVDYLEGLEDLIQDPHKMLDEVNGRRFMVQNYLDTGKKLDCRDKERCVHCFIEPFCTTMDRTVEAQREGGFDVWDLGDDAGAAVPLEQGRAPYGITRVGLRLPRLEAALDHLPPAGMGLELRVDAPGPVPAGLPTPLSLIADTPEACAAWALGGLPDGAECVVHLNRRTAPWLLAHRDRLHLPSLRVHQPAHEHLKEAVEDDVADPAAFFAQLGLRVRVSGLPACGAPGVELVPDLRRLSPAMFDPDTGRLAIRALAQAHVSTWYQAKSLRCRACPVAERCDGHHINAIRHQGLQLCRPLQGAWAADAAAQLEARWPAPRPRVKDGKPLEAPAPSLPGFAMPAGPVVDPLAAVAERLRATREARKAARLAGAEAPAMPYTPSAARGPGPP